VLLTFQSNTIISEFPALYCEERQHIIKYGGFTLLVVTESQGKHLLNKIIVLVDIDDCVTSYSDPVFYICRGFDS
jgi:hypothetical protein